MDMQQQQILHRKEKGSCSKTGTVSSLVPCTQSNFPQRKANYGKVAPRIENYAEISQRDVNTFVKTCPHHAEKKPLTSRVKSVQRPMLALTFLCLI